MVVSKMIRIVEVARDIWKKEPLQYIRVTVHQDHHQKQWYAEVEGMGIDSEFLDCWELVDLAPSEVEPAIKIIQRINFKGERVSYLDNGVELWVKSSPRVEKIRESISALRRADFYSEMHQEDECCSYSFILKNTEKAKNELRKFLKTYQNVSCYFEDGIYKLYM